MYCDRLIDGNNSSLIHLGCLAQKASLHSTSAAEFLFLFEMRGIKNLKCGRHSLNDAIVPNNKGKSVFWPVLHASILEKTLLNFFLGFHIIHFQIGL